MTTITVSAADVSLYHVAARELGDATQWWRLAQANDLADPDLTWLPNPVSITIPSTDSSLTDGLPELSA